MTKYTVLVTVCEATTKNDGDVIIRKAITVHAETPEQALSEALEMERL